MRCARRGEAKVIDVRPCRNHSFDLGPDSQRGRRSARIAVIVCADWQSTSCCDAKIVLGLVSTRVRTVGELHEGLVIADTHYGRPAVATDVIGSSHTTDERSVVTQSHVVSDLVADDVGQELAVCAGHTPRQRWSEVGVPIDVIKYVNIGNPATTTFGRDDVRPVSNEGSRAIDLVARVRAIERRLGRFLGCHVDREGRIVFGYCGPGVDDNLAFCVGKGRGIAVVTPRRHEHLGVGVIVSRGRGVLALPDRSDQRMPREIQINRSIGAGQAVKFECFRQGDVGDRSCRLGRPGVGGGFAMIRSKFSVLRLDDEHPTGLIDSHRFVGDR